MSEKTVNEVVGLAERMLIVSGARKLNVTWFGGEPLLAPDIIEELSGRLMNLAGLARAQYSANIVTNGYLLTPAIAEMLGRSGVTEAQVTLDGVGAEHDKTRRLAGGGATFERITENLRSIKLPFHVSIRHNVHEGNRNQIPELEGFVEKLARESGNNLTYYSAEVSGNDASDDRGSKISLLCTDDAGDVALQHDARAFSKGRGTFCGANKMYSVGIDEKGRLHKCWEDVDKPGHSFGEVSKWDPADPIATADRPDHLTRYLNTGLPMSDGECNECVWLPVCSGGCPNKRLYYTKQCLPYRNTPEKYVLALYERMMNEKRE